MNQDIKLEELTLSIDKKPILDKTDLIISNGHKYGLIGKNGIGKTTLFNYLNLKNTEHTKPSSSTSVTTISGCSPPISNETGYKYQRPVKYLKQHYNT